MIEKLSSNDKLALGAGALVETTALLALGDAWGMVMAVSFLAGLGAVAVILQPFLMPGAKLPMAKGMLLLILGLAAVVGTGISTLQNLRFISEELADFETLIFLAGLVFAFVLAYAGWLAYQAERGRTAPVAPAPAAPPPAAPPAVEG